MRIAHIKISNILGIEDLEFDAGQFNAITGPNGKGKTSVLEAIKAVTAGGHDATLLRAGAEKGEVVLVLDDGRELSKTITAAGSSQSVRDGGGKKIARPTEAIRTLVDQLSVNPVEFLMAPKKDRVRVLLESMPIEVDIKKLAELSGMHVEPAPGAHGLAVIDTAHKQVYDHRTGTNRAVKEKEATISQLRQALPDAIEGADGDETALQARVDQATAARDSVLGRIDAKITGIRTSNQAAIDEARAQAQQKIDAIKDALAKHVEVINTDTMISSAKADSARNKARDDCAATAGPLQAALAAIRGNRDAYAKRQGTLETIALLDSELEDLRTDAKHLSQSLADIEAYKSELLSSLPIPGLEVRDGEVIRHGIAFDRLNTAQQVDVAVEIAKLRAGKLGVICVDRIECLDAASLAAFREKALASGLQLFVSRVDQAEGAELSITTD